MGDLFKKILTAFPQRHMRMAFAYGSGVFKQQGHESTSANMLDFVFVVDNSAEWHRENLAAHRDHYSFLKMIGPKYIAHFQEKYGAGVYYNTLVPFEGRLIKYGVVGTKILVDDLLDWNTLYLSGRLHKPVKLLKYEEGEGLRSALLSNHQSALHAALLTLPDLFGEEQLYRAIAALSYSGDFRMSVGEDKNKVDNIVKPNVEQFRVIYEPLVKKEQHLFWNENNRTFEQNLDHVSRYHHLNLLPKVVQEKLVVLKSTDGHYRDLEEILHNLSFDDECESFVHKAVSEIVKQSSRSQSIKSVFAAGFGKSARYGWAKMKKMWKSSAT